MTQPNVSPSNLPDGGDEGSEDVETLIEQYRNVGLGRLDIDDYSLDSGLVEADGEGNPRPVWHRPSRRVEWIESPAFASGSYEPVGLNHVQWQNEVLAPLYEELDKMAGARVVRAWLKLFEEGHFETGRVDLTELSSVCQGLFEYLFMESRRAVWAAQVAYRYHTGEWDERVYLVNPPEYAVADLSDVASADEGDLVATEVRVKKASNPQTRVHHITAECTDDMADHAAMQVEVPRFAKASEVVPNECAGDNGQCGAKLNIISHTYWLRYAVISEIDDAEGDTLDFDAEVAEPLAEHVESGDRAVVVGIVDEDPREDELSPRSVLRVVGYESLKEATSIEEMDDDVVQEAWDIIEADESTVEQVKTTVAPNIIAKDEVYNHIRRGLILTAVGGQWGDSIRGTSHTALVGAPATGKTELVKSLAEITPYGTWGGAAGDTSSGLLASANQISLGDSETWMIQAGLIPRYDGGVVGIDEADKLSSETIENLASAMSDGSFQQNKAGRTAQFQSRTSLCLACNPSEKYFNEFSELKEQVPLPDEIQSRCDLIYYLFASDEYDEETASEQFDAAVTDVLEVTSEDKDWTPDDPREDAVDRDVARAVLALAERHTVDSITRRALLEAKETWDEIQTMFDTEYVDVRDQQTLIRLAQANARLEHRGEVVVDDVKTAARVFINSLSSQGKGELKSSSESDTNRHEELVYEIVAALEDDGSTAEKSEVYEACGEHGMTADDVKDIIVESERLWIAQDVGTTGDNDR